MENEQRGLFDNFTLKLIAILTMAIDHIGYTLFPDMMILRGIGRIAFPIFCFLIVEGFFHTRSHVNYLIRLGVFAILSEIPFDLAFHQQLFYWDKQNVFFTLVLGLLALFCLEELNVSRLYFVPLIILLAVAYFIKCDYGAGGVLLICMFYQTRNFPIGRIIISALLLYLFFGAFELYGALALIPITLYNGKKGPATKLFFYWFYPLHLLILYGIANYLV